MTPSRTGVPITQLAQAAITIAGLVKGLDAHSPNAERHLLALEQPGDKPESLVHDVTLLPRHAPSRRGQSVTHPLGIRCYLSLRKDKQFSPFRGAPCSTSDSRNYNGNYGQLQRPRFSSDVPRNLAALFVANDPTDQARKLVHSKSSRICARRALMAIVR